jgi:hypothetical protein
MVQHLTARLAGQEGDGPRASTRILDQQRLAKSVAG